MKKAISAALTAVLLFSGCSAFSPSAKSEDGNRVLFGNVYGTITAGETGNPVSDALIYVTDQPVRFVSEKADGAVLSDQGWIQVPPPETAIRRATSQPDGSYMVKGIPLKEKYGLYTVVIKADGFDNTVIDQTPVLPGASMALNINCRLPRTGKAQVIRVFKGHKNVDINYSDELKQPPQ
ncbi:MAG TPA: carboxypeptidase-like regulatory domain-containing protein [Desulfosalsimonadaceae bacterium]|nr:carboxypeptidase-like regulatory domain-containing protein [Desulfosalsimonadaceae bacterium]